jgi:hypothetical protein
VNQAQRNFLYYELGNHGWDQLTDTGPDADVYAKGDATIMVCRDPPFRVQHDIPSEPLLGYTEDLEWALGWV